MGFWFLGFHFPTIGRGSYLSGSSFSNFCQGSELSGSSFSNFSIDLGYWVFVSNV